MNYRHSLQKRTAVAALATLATLAMLAVLSALSGTARAETWVRADQRTVYFAPQAELKAQLMHLGATDEYWDQLEVSLAYEGASSERQAEELRKAYPGYQIRRVVVSVKGPLRLIVPAIDADVELKPMPGQEGPYANHTLYVSKAQSAALRKAFETSTDAVRVDGKIQVEVPRLQTVERVELDTSVCDTLASSGRTVFDVIRSYAQVRKLVDSKPIRYPQTRISLERSILESCLEISFERGVSSFHDLLEIPASQRYRPARPFGETQRDVPVQVAVPLAYRLSQERTGGQSP